MQGDYFSQTVTLLVEHNNDGAFGLIVNRPLNANRANFWQTIMNLISPQI